METCLVTGGAGFIGSHVADALLAEGRTVIVLDDLSGGAERHVPRGARFVRGSILDEGLLESLFSEYRFDYVFHLAAYAAEGLSHYIRRYNYETNLCGSVNLINRAVRFACKGFVFTSSIAVYGGGQTPMREDMIPSPEDPYGISKLAVELDLAAARRVFGLNSIVFRPHNVYGERQNLADPYRNVIGIFMRQALRGEPMTIFGDGSQTRAFSYIGDVAPVIAGSIRRPGAWNETFNIGASEPRSVRDLAECVARVLGVPPDLRFLPSRPEALHAFSSHERVERVFGRRSPVRLEEGLERMARWARGQRLEAPRPFGRIEIRRGLPPSWSALCDLPESPGQGAGGAAATGGKEAGK